MGETIKGGYYLDAQGQAHNAEGKPIPKRKKDAEAAAEAEPASELEALRARIAELEAQGAGEATGEAAEVPEGEAEPSGPAADGSISDELGRSAAPEAGTPARRPPRTTAAVPTPEPKPGPGRPRRS